MMLVVIRMGSQLPVPGSKPKLLFAAGLHSRPNDAFNFFHAFTGGSFEKMSIFALSITPYITSSIIIQLLTIAIPAAGGDAEAMEKMARKKIALLLPVM